MPAPKPLKNDDIFNAYNQEVKGKGFHIFNDSLAKDFSKCQMVSPWTFDQDQNPATRMSLAQKNYKALQDILVAHIDRQNGITTVIDDSFPAPGSPNGIPCIRRDARQAKPLNQRLDPNHLVFHIDDTLLRALNTARTLDYMLQKRAESHAKNEQRVEHYWGEQEKLMQLMGDFLLSVTDIQQRFAQGTLTESAAKKELQQKHARFNAHLCGLIHRNHFDHGLKKKNAAEYEKLLNHYRQMASVLDPAPAQQTISADKHGVTHIETAYPITEKTAPQKEAMKTMQRVVAKPTKKERDFHTSQNEAYQEINVAFYDLIQDDSRRLSSQTRKTHLGCGVRNGYLCKDELVFPAKGDKPEKTVARKPYVRVATIAYVGKGESEQRKKAFAAENLVQINMMYQKHVTDGAQHVPHFLMLNTFSPLEDQDLMYYQTRAAIAERRAYFSYVPTNIEGTLRHPEFSKVVSKHPQAPMAISKPFHKSARLNQAVQVLSVAELEPGVFLIESCASGRDRTGAICKAKKLEDAVKIYLQEGVQMSRDEIETMQTIGGHEVMLATLEVPGSHGMKTDSIPGGYFSKKSTEHSFLKTADTNKNQPIDEALLERELKTKRNRDCEHDLIRVAVSIRKFAERRDWNPFTRSNSVKAALWLELAAELERAQHDNKPRTMSQILDDWSKRTVVVDKTTGATKQVADIMKEQRSRFKAIDAPGETESAHFRNTLVTMAERHKLGNPGAHR